MAAAQTARAERCAARCDAPAATRAHLPTSHHRRRATRGQEGLWLARRRGAPAGDSAAGGPTRQKRSLRTRSHAALLRALTAASPASAGGPACRLSARFLVRFGLPCASSRASCGPMAANAATLRLQKEYRLIQKVLHAAGAIAATAPRCTHRLCVDSVGGR
jgi:hypothetical protein